MYEEKYIEEYPRMFLGIFCLDTASIGWAEVAQAFHEYLARRNHGSKGERIQELVDGYHDCLRVQQVHTIYEICP